MNNLSPRRSLRLRHNFSQTRKKLTSGNVVFYVPELLTRIVDCCSWASRITLSHASVHARLVVQASIRRRIRVIFKPFVKDLSAFFALLGEIRGAVVGSAVWNVMTMDNIGPRDINVVVPNDSVYGVERLKSLLTVPGSSVTFDGYAGIVYESRASRFIKVMQKSFNVLTACGLYCLYPKLLSRRETVHSMALCYTSEVERIGMRGVRVISPDAYWTVPCGEACMPVWRRTEVLDGAGIMYWGGYDAGRTAERFTSLSKSDDINYSNHKWRLGVHCCNPACINSKNSTLI